jgi:hypothetical protein
MVCLKSDFCIFRNMNKSFRLLVIMQSTAKESEDSSLIGYLSNNFYCCRKCNKKYKTTDKFIKHMEENHPFTTINSNNEVLSLEDKFYLLDCLESYSKLLSWPFLLNIDDDSIINDSIRRYTEWNGISEADSYVQFVWASHKLDPIDYVSDKVAESEEQITNLRRMVKNHGVFCRRVNESLLLKKALSGRDQLLIMFDEFQRFLNLGRPWQGGNFCPSLIIDLIWHSSMMDNKKYIELCKKFIGSTLSHCLLENETHHKERYTAFEKQYTHRFNRVCLKIDQLLVGPDNAIEEMRIIFLREKEQKIQQIRERDQRFEEWKLTQESFPTPIGWRSPFDDGKC